MEIVSIRPLTGSGNSLARFDVQIGSHLRLFNLVLKQGNDGRLRTYAPTIAGKHSASFHPELAQQITNAAVAAMEGDAANEHRK